MTHWDMLNKATKFEFSLFNMSQLRHLLSSMTILHHVIAQLQKAPCNYAIVRKLAQPLTASYVIQTCKNTDLR